MALIRLRGAGGHFIIVAQVDCLPSSERPGRSHTVARLSLPVPTTFAAPTTARHGPLYVPIPYTEIAASNLPWRPPKISVRLMGVKEMYKAQEARNVEEGKEVAEVAADCRMLHQHQRRDWTLTRAPGHAAAAACDLAGAVVDMSRTPTVALNRLRTRARRPCQPRKRTGKLDWHSRSPVCSRPTPKMPMPRCASFARRPSSTPQLRRVTTAHVIYVRSGCEHCTRPRHARIAEPSLITLCSPTMPKRPTNNSHLPISSSPTTI